MNIKIKNWYYEVEIQQVCSNKNLWTNGVNPCTPGQSTKSLDCPGNPCTIGRYGRESGTNVV